MKKQARTPLVVGLYHQYLADQDPNQFAASVCDRYSVATLERLCHAGDRMARRAAVLSLGLISDYSSNAALGRALNDDDRGVRILAENGIRHLWCRVGTRVQRKQLAAIIELNTQQRHADAITSATRLVESAPWLAEGWNQRALALFNLGRHAEAIRDCRQALEINPYHFGAASGMGQCHLQLNNRATALDCFRRALRLNPNLEGVRAQVAYLQRTLNGQE